MSRLIFTNANLLDGDSPPASNRTIVIDGERILSIGADPQVAEESDRVVDLHGHTVMPGMATCHYHSTYPSGSHKGFAPYGYEYPPGYQALIAHRNLLTALQQGYTVVVGAGAANEIDPAIKQAIDDGFVLGPRFTPSGRELSTTGHANDMSAPWYWHLPSLGAARNCDGPEAFTRAVREEVKMGVKVIKLFVTRGHLVPGSNAQMEMTREELAAAIDAAHSRQVLIRGHLSGKEAIMMAIELGIDIVDHCDEMDDEVIAALAETGTFVVPSIYYPKLVAEMMEGQGQAEAAEVKRGLQFMYDALPKAEVAGVRLLLGDDYGGPRLRHGDYGGELHTYVDDVGLSPVTVIRWATRNGAELIGHGDDLGTIEEGRIADLLVIEGDPTVDIGVLADKNPLAVLKSGVVVSGALPS
jgi:imidazolonepropionase-like amidohydrolase